MLSEDLLIFVQVNTVHLLNCDACCNAYDSNICHTNLQSWYTNYCCWFLLFSNLQNKHIFHRCFPHYGHLKLACQMGCAQYACCWTHLRTQLAPVVYATHRYALSFASSTWAANKGALLSNTQQIFQWMRNTLQICLNRMYSANHQPNKGWCRNSDWRRSRSI